MRRRIERCKKERKSGDCGVDGGHLTHVGFRILVDTLRKKGKKVPKGGEGEDGVDYQSTIRKKENGV